MRGRVPDFDESLRFRFEYPGLIADAFRTVVSDAYNRAELVMPLGEELLRVSAAGFARIRRRWVRTLGAQHVAALEEALAHMAGDASKLGDLPGWLR